MCLGIAHVSGKVPLSGQGVGDKFGESLGGSQAPPSFWEVPGLPRKFPEPPRKFFDDFPGSSLTVELNSNPEVPRKFPRLPRKFPRLPRKFPGLPRKFPDFPGGQPLPLRSLTPSPDSQKLSLNWGSDRYTMYLPFSPYRFLGRKGQMHCVSARPLVPGEGLYQIHGQSLNTHRGKHRSGGAQLL